MLKTAYFTEEEILKLKNTKDPELRKLVDTLVEGAEGALKNGGGLISLGFGYYYTGNKAYIDKALEMLHKEINEGVWTEDDNDNNYGFEIRASLPTETKVSNVAGGLSLFGDLIPEEDFKYLVEQVYVKGILPILEDWVLPGTRRHALDTMGHNFWIVITSGAAMGLAILKDYIPNGQELFEQVVAAIKAWFEYKGNPMNSKPQNIDKGAFFEGVTYADYSYNTYLNFANAYKNITGEHPFDDMAIIEQAAQFIVSCWYPSDNNKDYYVGFGDCEQPQCSLNSPLSMIRYGVRDPELLYYVKHRNLKKYDLSKALLWDILNTEEEALPTARGVLYGKIGWGIFRDGYEEDSVMLAVKCGDTWNHAHADACHFNLYRNKRPEIYDTLQAHSYSSEAYHKYYVESIGHNVLLFNDKGQDFRDNYKDSARCRGQLVNFTDQEGFKYVCANGTGPMGRYFRKHHRHFIWMNGFILIYDDVECYECGKVSFLLHAKDNHTFRMISDATVEKRKGYIDGEFKETNCEYTVYNCHTDDEGHVKFLGVILLDETLNPTLTEIQNGWKVICGDTTIYINHRADGKVVHRNCINVMEGITTDAEILTETKGQYAMVNGSLVRKDGVSIYESFARTTGIIK